MDFIYLDNNATTKPAPEVVAAMDAINRDTWANPSSIHRPGQAARQKIELARKALAALIGARPRQITLTGSGTEAIDLAIRGGLRARLAPSPSAPRPDPIPARPAAPPPPAAPVSIITTRAEHSAIRELAADLERFGLDGAPVRVHWAPMTADGLADAGAIERLLTDDPSIALVSVQWANNETGAIQPVARIAEACRARGVLYHCDATQWVGKMPTAVGIEATWHQGIESNDSTAAPHESSPSLSLRPFVAPSLPPPIPPLPADLLTFSAHKFHGPKGVGALYTRPGVRVAPIILGEQELGRRGGTENTAAIAGAGVAAELASAWLADEANIIAGRALRDRFERAVIERARAAGVDASINGPVDPFLRLWNTSNIAFTRLEAEALLLLLSERGVCCSAGAACSSGSLEPSSVLLATGIPPEKAHGSLRFSLSRFTTADEIDRAVVVIADCVARLRQSMSAMMAPPLPTPPPLPAR